MSDPHRGERSANHETVASPAGARALLQQQAALLTAVATGGPRIEAVNAEYREQRAQLNESFRLLGIEPPFPWRDLWEWYGHYSRELPNYAGRRQLISSLVGTAEDALDRLTQRGMIDDFGGKPVTPSWARLEGRITELKDELAVAQSPDDLQDVGRRAREILIELGRLALSDEALPSGIVAPKQADAKQRLALFLEAKASGAAHQELRQVVRAAWELTQKVTHSESVERIDALAAAQATVLLVRVIQDLAAS